jgi:hypothetical protein
LVRLFTYFILTMVPVLPLEKCELMVTEIDTNNTNTAANARRPATIIFVAKLKLRFFTQKNGSVPSIQSVHAFIAFNAKVMPFCAGIGIQRSLAGWTNQNVDTAHHLVLMPIKLPKCYSYLEYTGRLQERGKQNQTSKHHR